MDTIIIQILEFPGVLFKNNYIQDTDNY